MFPVREMEGRDLEEEKLDYKLYVLVKRRDIIGSFSDCALFFLYLFSECFFIKKNGGKPHVI